MEKRHFADNINRKVIDVVNYIIDYFRTLYALICHPNKTLPNLLRESNSSYLMKPGVFLLINILLTYSIGRIFGYGVPIFPFDTTLLNNVFGSFSFVVISYIIGILFYLFLIKLIFFRTETYQFITNAFPIICYGSAIYIPFIIAKGFCGNYLGKDLFTIASAYLSEMPIKINISQYLIFFLCLAIPFTIFIWWVRLIYFGFVFLNKAKPLKIKVALITALLLFYLTSLTIGFASTYSLNSSMLQGIIAMYTKSIEKELSKIPPNYYKAYFLSETISENRMMPESVRYIYKLKKISYLLATPAYNNDKELVDRVLNQIEARRYINLEKILNDHLKELNVIINVENELQEVESLRNSSDFIDLSGKHIFVHFYFVEEAEPLSPDAVRLNGDDFIVLFPIVTFPRVISIFP